MTISADNDDGSLSPAVDKALGERIAAMRSAKGLSVSRLAELSGVDQRTLRLQEEGVAPLSSMDCVKVSRALGVELSDLFKAAATPPATRGDVRGNS